MKNRILLSAFLLVGFCTFAQAPLEQGRLQLNAGLGTSGWGTPVYLGLDYGIAEDITIGGELSYRSYDQRYVNDEFSSTIFGVQANGNYHFTKLLEIPSKWDVYAGLSLNYYKWTTNDRFSQFVDSSDIGVGAQAGARYFFTDKFGINIEFGGGNATSGGKIGITYKL